MAQGVLHRAGVAIVLIATLLLPYGRCQSPARATGHDCCVHATAPTDGIKANCCTIRSQLPAIVAPRIAVCTHPLPAVDFSSSFAAPATRVAPAKIAVAHHSPPPVASVLRI